MSQTQLSNNDRNTIEILEETDSSRQAKPVESTPTLLLRLEQPRDDRRVVFHDGVIDNEHMNRMKSKCCCIYKKPLAFGESSSDDDDECEHCYGHPEQRKKNKKKKHSGGTDSCQHDDQPSTSAEAQSEPDAAVSEPNVAAAVEVVEPMPQPDFETTVKPSL